jgi:hypothetical protein
MPDQYYHELGRRLCAAFVSMKLRLKSMDYAAKAHVGDDVSEYWVELAKEIESEVHHGLVKKLRGVLHAERRNPTN